MKDRTARRPSAHASPAATFETLETRRLLAAAAGDAIHVELGYDRSTLHQTWEGTGAAMDQWKFGQTYADPKFFNDLVGDVGVNIVRIPVWQGFENVNDNADADVTDLSKFDSKALDPTMRFAQQMAKRSPDLKVLASVWTPPYWMKTNAAHNRGGALRADMYEEFAEYLSAYVQVAQKDWGVDIDVLSLQNEPFFIEEYESAVYTPEQMARLIKVVHERFVADGITTRLSVHEDLNFDDRFKWWADKLLSDPQVADIDFQWGSHYIPPSTYADVAEVVESSGRPLWITEGGGAGFNDWNAALHLADKMAWGMNEGELSAYLDWQFDGDGGSSFYLYGNKGPRYHAMKHFAHYIRPGARRAEVSLGGETRDVKATGWYDPARKTETLVLVNDSGTTDAYFHVVGTTGRLQGWASSESAQFVPVNLEPDPLGVPGPNQKPLGVTVKVPARGLVTLYNGLSDPVEWTPASTDRAGWDYVLAPDGTNYEFKKGLNTAALNADYYGVTRNADAAGGNVILDRYGNGRNSLFYTAAAVMDETVRLENWLIDRGANPNDVDNEGITPTMVAASNPWVLYYFDQNLTVDKTKNLVDRGGSLAAKDFKGRTTLHWAATTAQFQYGGAKAQDPRVVNYLLSAGADVNKVDRFGMKPADWAREMGNYANLALIDAWTSDTAAPEMLERTVDLERGPSVKVDFDEAMAKMTAQQMNAAVSLNLLNADGSVKTAMAFNAAASTLAAGNTRLEVRPNRYRMADGYYRLDAVGTALKDEADNAFEGSLATFSFLGADANHDKKVDIGDFIPLRRNMGKRGVGFSGGDFDFDGVVGINDFLILRRQFGKTLGPAPAGFGETPVAGTPEAAKKLIQNTVTTRRAAAAPAVASLTGTFVPAGGVSPFGATSLEKDSTLLAELK